MPDQSDPREALASYTLGRDKGVRLGSVIQVIVPTPAQIRLGPSKVKLSELPRRRLRVVGLVVTENEFPAGTGNRYDLFVTRAYAAAVNPHAMVVSSYYVRLRHGAADQSAFDAALRPLGSFGADDLDIDAVAVQRGITPQAAGWLGLACLAALAGLAVVGQAAARQFTVERRTTMIARAWAECPSVRHDRAGAGGGHRNGGRGRRRRARGGPVAADPGRRSAARGRCRGCRRARSGDHHARGGHRRARHRGSAAWPAVRNAPARRQAAGLPFFPGLAVRAVTWTGAPPAAVDPRQVRARARTRPVARRVPVGTALLGSVLAPAALCATAIFGASLARLDRDARSLRRAVPGPVCQREPRISSRATSGLLLTSLRNDQAIARITLASVAQIDVNGRPVRAVAARLLWWRCPHFHCRRPYPARYLVRSRSGPRRCVVPWRVTRRLFSRRHHPSTATGARRTVPFVVTVCGSSPPSLETGCSAAGAAITTAWVTVAQGLAALRGRRAWPGWWTGTMYRGLDAVYLARRALAPLPGTAKRGHPDPVRRAGPTSRPGQFRRVGELPGLLFGGLLALFRAARTVSPPLVSVARRRLQAGAAQGARLRPPPGRRRGQLAGDRGRAGGDHRGRAAGHRGGQDRLAGVRHELRRRAGRGRRSPRCLPGSQPASSRWPTAWLCCPPSSPPGPGPLTCSGPNEPATAVSPWATFRALAGNRALTRVVAGYALFVLSDPGCRHRHAGLCPCSAAA